ncbi:hypothetical protein HY065_01940, partial [Candidatus Berkelbacteria bacterium]|nr:hypothetical protein [Candidatus Berkelbacteria bacterium]
MKAKARINLLIGLILALFLAGALYGAWYLGRKQTTQADVSLLPVATTSQLAPPVTSGAKTTTTPSATAASAPPGAAAQDSITLQLSAGYNLVSFGHRFSPSNCRNVFANLSTHEVSAMRQGKWVSCFTDSE